MLPTLIKPFMAKNAFEKRVETVKFRANLYCISQLVSLTVNPWNSRTLDNQDFNERRLSSESLRLL